MGVATATVTPMVNVLIGEHLPPEKRTGAIGITISSIAVVYLAVTFGATYIQSISSWRLALLILITPLTFLTLILLFVIIPKIESRVSSAASTTSVLDGYRHITKNRSALACLLGTALGLATWNVYLTYLVSFQRQVFGVTLSLVSLATVVNCFSYFAGSLSTGRFVKMFGRKPLTSTTLLVIGFCTAAIGFSPSFYVSVGISVVSAFLAGMMITSSTSLSLEQLPDYRGSMMSIHSACTILGSLLAASIGGVVLTYWGYGVYGFVMGMLGVSSCLIFHFYSIDVVKK
jgi:predicted MFS family arabinose efflux permease